MGVAVVPYARSPSLTPPDKSLLNVARVGHTRLAVLKRLQQQQEQEREQQLPRQKDQGSDQESNQGSGMDAGSAGVVPPKGSTRTGGAVGNTAAAVPRQDVAGASIVNADVLAQLLADGIANAGGGAALDADAAAAFLAAASVPAAAALLVANAIPAINAAY
jgi:hypothetical protein